MPSGAQRFAQQAAENAAKASRTPELDQAVVTAVSAATPPVATVSFRGGSYQFPHLSAYTPAVNDVVAIQRYAGSWLILGRPVGFP